MHCEPVKGGQHKGVVVLHCMVHGGSMNENQNPEGAPDTWSAVQGSMLALLSPWQLDSRTLGLAVCSTRLINSD